MILDLYKISNGSVLDFYWISIGSALDLQVFGIDQYLELDKFRIVLDHCWIGIRALIGTVLDLY